MNKSFCSLTKVYLFFECQLINFFSAMDKNEPQPGPSSSRDGASGGGEPKTLSEFLALPENKGQFALVIPIMIRIQIQFILVIVTSDIVSNQI